MRPFRRDLDADAAAETVKKTFDPASAEPLLAP